MDTGDKQPQYSLLEIAIPVFNINAQYENAVLSETDIEWMAGYEFWVERIDDDWSRLTSQAIITLKRTDKKKVAEMVLRSFFKVTCGLSTEHKKAVLYLVVNETMAHAQGAWTIMNHNPSIAALIPQALEHFDKDSEEAKAMMKKRWGKWSNK